jgi:hypothetical protein
VTGPVGYRFTVAFSGVPTLFHPSDSRVIDAIRPFTEAMRPEGQASARQYHRAESAGSEARIT